MMTCLGLVCPGIFLLFFSAVNNLALAVMFVSTFLPAAAVYLPVISIFAIMDSPVCPGLLKLLCPITCCFSHIYIAVNIPI